MPEQKPIDILMYGMRRTGKSSVLASMIGQFQEAAKGTPLQLKPTASTATIMRQKLITLEKTFYEADYLNHPSFLFRGDAEDDPGFTPTYEVIPYHFDLTYREAEKTEPIAKLTFWDVPGEIYHSQDQQAMDEVADKMKRCSILIVAVDAVHLMEEGGKYSQSFHSPRILSNCISLYWSEEKNMAPKLVLFVPLKCEKYYHSLHGQSPDKEKGPTLDDVGTQIKKTFALPIDTLKKIPGPVTIAITPILTMGSVEFDHFGCGEDGKVLLQPVLGMKGAKKPARVYYRFTGDRNFSPRFCEQPVLYVLSFIINSTKRVKELEDQKKEKKKKGSLFKGLAGGLMALLIFNPAIAALYLAGRFLLGNKKVMTAYEKISVRLKKAGDGYEIIQDPLGL